MQTQAAIAGALLAYRTGPDQDVFTTNQIISALVAYRSAASRRPGHGKRPRASQPRCSATTIAQVDGRGRRGGGRHRRADPGPHGRLQRGPGHAHRGSERGRLHPDPGGEPVEHRAHLQLDPGPRASLRLPLPATASNFVVYMSEADNVYTGRRSCTLKRTSRTTLPVLPAITGFLWFVVKDSCVERLFVCTSASSLIMMSSHWCVPPSRSRKTLALWSSGRDRPRSRRCWSR